MDKDEQPITDKENFPPEGGASLRVLSLDPMMHVAYYDGLSSGYRKAMLDVMLWASIVIVMVVISRHFSATN